MNKMLLFLPILSLLSTVSCDSKTVISKKSVATQIKEAYLRTFKNDKNNINLINITRYLGNDKNVYAVVLKYERKWLIRDIKLEKIRIDDYVSTTYYNTIFPPLVFQKNNLYTLEQALTLNIITLDFVKDFDIFQIEHSPEELNYIYE